MSSARPTAVSRNERTSARRQNFVLGAWSSLRQNPGSWWAFRTILGSTGVALVILPLTLSTNWLAAPAGLFMFVTSILLPPSKSHLTSDQKARELGALTVVDGGTYKPFEAGPASVQLFVGSEQICVLNSRFQPLLIIPVAEIASVEVIEQNGRWFLCVLWSDTVAEFRYRGASAEDLARIAESAISSVIPRPRPALGRSRAAGA